MKENKHLKQEIGDLSKTLNSNKEIVNALVEKISLNKYKEIITELENEKYRISKQNIKLYNDNLELETKLFNTSQEVTKKLSCYENKIIQLTNDIFVFENKINEKEVKITSLQNELKKYDTDDYYITNKKIYVTSPNEINVVLNNELCEARELLKKYTHFIHEATKKIDQQKKTIHELNQIINNIKKGKEIKKNIDNIEQFDYLLSIDSMSQSSQDKDTILESPIEQFPSKVNHKRFLTSYNTTNQDTLIPRLDLSDIIDKYRPVSKHKKEEQPQKEVTKIDEDYIEKLKYHNKILLEMNRKYKEKCREQSKVISMLKMYVMKISRKRNSMASTTDRIKDQVNEEDILDNIKVNKEEMEVNFESEYNEMVKDYNRNEINILSETNKNYMHTSYNNKISDCVH